MAQLSLVLFSESDELRKELEEMAHVELLESTGDASDGPPLTATERLTESNRAAQGLAATPRCALVCSSGSATACRGQRSAPFSHFNSATYA